MKKIKFIFVLAALILSSEFGSVLAVDGSGTNAVSPGSVVAGAAGNTFNFTFTAAETMDSGEITVAVPSGWTVPQGTSGTAGYTTVNSTAGIIADVINNADSATNWQRGNCNSITVNTITKHEGIASIECVNLSQGNNHHWYYRLGSAVNWSAYSNIGF